MSIRSTWSTFCAVYVLHHICYDMGFRRALAAQKEARVKEVLAQAKSLQSVMTVGRKALQVRLT